MCTFLSLPGKENTTPKKVYFHGNTEDGQQRFCRLCGESNCGRYIRIFGGSNVADGLPAKIETVTGIIVSDATYDVICRKCSRFIENVISFRKKCQSVQSSSTKNYVVKRMAISPKSVNNSFVKTNKANSKKRLKFSTTDNVSQQLPTQSTVITNSTSVFNKQSSIYKGSLLTTNQCEYVIRSAQTRISGTLANSLALIPSVNYATKSIITADMSRKSDDLCKMENGSVLLGKGFEDLKNFSMKSIWDEMKKCQPFLVDILSAIAGSKHDIDETPENVKVKFCFIYAILMNIKWNKLSNVQRINTVLMIEGGGSKKLLERLNNLGVTLSSSRKPYLLDLIGGHFCDKAVEAVKNGKTLRGTGDNWDIRVLRSHMTKELQNEDIHMFASNIIVNRLNFTHLQNDRPLRDLATCSRSVFLLSNTDLRRLRENFKVLISRVCIKYLPKFKFLKRVTPNHIKHIYSKEMAERSHIISLPIIDANEAKYDHCVKILRQYESWVFEIFKKAGHIQQRDLYNPVIPAGDAARPDQPGAHVQDTQDDPMLEMKIPFSGDQLTRVRFAGAKDLLSGAHTPSDRFEHCSPFKPAMWHCKASLLQYCYSLLYDSNSFNQLGTLKYFREKYNRKNVTPKKVHDSYDGCEDFFLSVGQAYIVVALLNFFGMESVDEYPTKHKFMSNMSHKGDEDIKVYFDTVIGAFVDAFIFQRDQAPNPGEEEDYVKNYSLMIMYLAVIVLQLKDAAEGDGERNLTNQKLLMTIFKSMNAYSKYALEMFVSIALIECLSSERISNELKWGFFNNWTGGNGKNIEDDLTQEIFNCISKNAVKRLGANKTLKSISDICKATTGIRTVVEKVDEELNIHRNSTQHTAPSAFNDELGMITELIQLNPFEYSAGRFHACFPDIQRSPMKYLNINDYNNWIKLHQKNMSGN